jgi:structural maintenance of chromosome 2
VIGGKNKYIINGKTVQPSDVKDMFHSVQLNVNNPHFLIMQGRITKVLNMKPAEILSMIEETAGTKMFQTKKEAALKTIEKKQQKVEDLSKCMEETIGPEMEGLREKLQQYTIFTSNATELARLERFCVAGDYQSFQESVTENETGKQAIVDELAANEATKSQKKLESDECASKIDKINSLLKAGMKEAFSALKEKEEELGKGLVKVKTLLKNQTENTQSEKEISIQLEGQVLAAKECIAAKETDLAKMESEVKAKQIESEEAEKNATQIRDRHHNALAGVADESSADVLSLPEQVAILEKRAREALSTLQQGAQKMEYAKIKLKELRASAKATLNNHGQEAKEAETLKTAIAACELKLKGASFNEKEEESLKAKSAALQASTSSLRDKVERITAQLEAKLSFDYKDPEKGFDRSKVKGLVARLVKIKNSLNATALEVAAGGKLFQVVVDTELTGKLLLKKGVLRNRVTILPLNRISSRCTDPAKVTYAKELAAAKGAQANLALELVGFEEEVRQAMEFTFGNIIICNNSDVARDIAFDKKILNKTVTLEGDSYDPSGVMTGGSRKQLGSLLCLITELATATTELEAQLKELAATDSQLQRMESQGTAARGLGRELDLKRHALKMCEEKLAESDYSQICNDVTALEASLVALELVGLRHYAYHDTCDPSLYPSSFITSRFSPPINLISGGSSV